MTSDTSTLWLYDLVQVCVVSLLYIAASASLISFNKYLMEPERFPHASALTVLHMIVSTTASLALYSAAPALYPAMKRAMEHRKALIRYMIPLGICNAVSLVCANTAYKYSSIAFLQFLKEGNVVLAFMLSCVLGLQVFSWRKAMILSVILTGCSVCLTGEIDFMILGLVYQLISQVAEVSKNLMGEILLTGADLKLDPMTFVAFQAPFALLFLLASIGFMDSLSEIAKDLSGVGWPLLLCNALVAFVLNIAVALTIKHTSTVAFILIGMVKDVIIVTTSAILFSSPISRGQQVGFVLIIAGIAMWSYNKGQEQAEVSKASALPDESDPLVPKMAKSSVEKAPETA